MTSLRQVQANRRNATKSTGPNTGAGKDRSRRNAVRHGLTAETIIGALEDAEDYKRFEASITADFDPETAVERELVLRLASLLWRLRRAASIETGMLQNCTMSYAGRDPTPKAPGESFAGATVHLGSLHHPPEPSIGSFASEAQPTHREDPDRAQNPPLPVTDLISQLAERFLCLAVQDNGAFERLGRYETALWRQICQTVFMLDLLRRQNLDTKWLPKSSHPGGKNTFALSLFPRR